MKLSAFILEFKLCFSFKSYKILYLIIKILLENEKNRYQINNYHL